MQLRRVRQGTQIEEDHMRNRQMIVGWLMANTKAIDVRTRDGKTYYVMNDPAAFREGVGRLLSEVQRIKAEGDYAAAKQLFETYGVHFDPKLRDEVVARVERLHLPSYSGFVMPKLEAVRERRRRNHRRQDFLSPGSDVPDAGVRGRDAEPSSVGRWRFPPAFPLISGPTVWPRPFSGRGRPGRSSISPSRIPRARVSIIRPICWLRWPIHAGLAYEPSPFGLPGRAARRGARLRTAGDDGRPAPHRALGQHERRVFAAVQAARRRGRRDPRAPAQLSAVRSPDAAGRSDGRPVRPRIPRPVDDRHGERRARADAAHPRAPDRQPQQPDRIVREARRARAPRRALCPARASRSSQTKCSATTSSSRARRRPPAACWTCRAVTRWASASAGCRSPSGCRR